MVGESLLHGLPLVGLPNIYYIYIYIYIYIYMYIYKSKDGPWALCISELVMNNLLQWFKNNKQNLGKGVELKNQRILVF